MKDTKFKRNCQKNRLVLLGLIMKAGEKKFTFAGCGPKAILLNYKVSGADVTQLSTCKLWVEYDNINPNLKGQIIDFLVKEGVW